MTEDQIKENETPVSAENDIEGDVKVHDTVLESIARKSALNVPGVLRLSGSSLIDSLAEIVGSRKAFDKAIVISSEEGKVVIEVRIIVKYGSHVPEVAAAVQKNVMEDITRLTGMEIAHVDVVVMDLEEDNTAAEPVTDEQ